MASKADIVAVVAVEGITLKCHPAALCVHHINMLALR